MKRRAKKNDFSFSVNVHRGCIRVAVAKVSFEARGTAR
jgi:hypothetical protein